MLTFQDFVELAKSNSIEKCIAIAIKKHQRSAAYREALTAEKYEAQENEHIMQFISTLITKAGGKIKNPVNQLSPIPSNYFHRLNTQRVSYSLGNGVIYDAEVKDKLGKDFDTKINDAALDALEQGAAFLFWNYDHVEVFPLLEFVPLFDEVTGVLCAGIRFTQIAANKPVVATLYEADGYTKFRTFKSKDGKKAQFAQVEDKKPYIITTQQNKAEGVIAVDGKNYGVLPIVALWGNKRHRSTLVGMKEKIDAYDLIQSGFADTVEKCQEVYWIVDNAGGMNDKDFATFRDNLLYRKIASIDADNGVRVTPYKNEIPTEAHSTALQQLHDGLYKDFGALDVSTISAASKTATEITAAYQPMDDEADAFEYQIIAALQSLLAIIGIEATPSFKRNRIANQLEETQMILAARDLIGDDMALRKLPFIDNDDLDKISDYMANNANARYNFTE